MVKVIVVSHNTLAKSLVETLEMIAGQKLTEYFSYLTLQLDAGIDGYQKDIDEFILHNDSDLLVLCDLGYGSPISTLYARLCETKFQFRIISGVNMAMMLTAYTNLDKDLTSLSEIVWKEARDSINYCFEKIHLNEDDE